MRLPRCKYIGLENTRSEPLGQLPRRIQPSRMSSFKRPCSKTKNELEGRTTDMGILARLHIEGAHLGEHEGGRWSLQLDGSLKFDYKVRPESVISDAGYGGSKRHST